jgi:F-type H+-transporting ATPase subunit epsilon|uniref:ATP synthase CF0 subunit C n=1 Tax=Prototheca lentecrescens TaxID=2836214 RepID=UPI003002904C
MVMRVLIITPEHPIWNSEVDEIIIPTPTGQIGILKNHISSMTKFDISIVYFRIKEKWISFIMMNGFVLIKNNKITFLVKHSESDIDELAIIKKPYQKLKKKINLTKTDKEKVKNHFELKLY